MKTKFVFTLALIYLIVRFGFTIWLDTLFAYSSFVFEVCMVALVGYLSWPSLKNQWRIQKNQFLFFVIAFAGGFIIYKLAPFVGANIPFDVLGPNVWFFLLLVAPLLEEMIFRFFLWEPLKAKPKIALVSTALVFSYAHFHTFWFIAPDMYGFIYYQTIYTLVLGLACGWMVYKYYSLAAAILLHFAFNLGFYLAAV